MSGDQTEQRIRNAFRVLAERAPTGDEARSRGTLLVDHEPSGFTGTGGLRRRGLEAGAVAAAVAAVAVITVGISSILGGNGSSGSLPSASQPSGIGGQPTVTIGRGRAILDVPASWGRGQMECGQATADTVAFSVPSARLCGATGPSRFNSLIISSAAGRSLGPKASAVQLGADQAYELAGHEGRFFIVQIVVPSQDAYFSVQTTNDQLTQAIADSLRLLPATKTTVPDLTNGATGGRPGSGDAPAPQEVTLRLRQAHLIPNISFGPGADPTHWSALAVDQPAGTVVQRGSVVGIRYSFVQKTP